MKINILIGSPVGVITAAITAIATMAIRQPFNSIFAFTSPILARMKKTKGIKKLTPIQKSRLVTKGRYDLIRIEVVTAKMFKKSNEVGSIT